MKPRGAKRCHHRRIVAILFVGSLVSVWKSTPNVKVLHSREDEKATDARRIREDLEFAPTFTVREPVKFFPRVHQLDDGSSFNATKRGKSGSHKIQYPLTTVEAMEQAYDGADQTFQDFERDWFTQCEPILKITVRPTCNPMHEMNAFASTSVSLLSMEGSWRSVWKVEDERSAILKMLQLSRDYNDESFSIHETDAQVMERLTGSPHIVSSYGYCAQSVLTQIAYGSSSHVIKNATLSWRDRLTVARDIAKGLAELHALDPWKDYEDIIQTLSQSSDPINSFRAQTFNRSEVFVHNDINPANVISLHAKQVHWNDFNLGIFSKKHRSTGKACPVPVRYQGALWRSPEEIENYMGHVSTLHPADVYAFGALLFVVLTRHVPWNNLEIEQMTEDIIATRKKEGDLPFLPSRHTPERTEAKVLWAAAKACFRRDPSQRPTASRLAVGLGLALGLIQRKKVLSDEVIESLFIV
jgi:Protein kinase domain